MACELGIAPSALVPELAGRPEVLEAIAFHLELKGQEQRTEEMRRRLHDRLG